MPDPAVISQYHLPEDGIANVPKAFPPAAPVVTFKFASANVAATGVTANGFNTA